MFPPNVHHGRAMIFVDGENLTCRIQDEARKHNMSIRPDVEHEPDVMIWAPEFGRYHTGQVISVPRTYYYTAMRGDVGDRAAVSDRLKKSGAQAPRVFPKDKNRGSKQVDISLTTDMLWHTFHKNLDIAILVAGDEDYVPLVKAVQQAGAVVALWFLPNGLSPKLQREADHYWDLSTVFIR